MDMVYFIRVAEVRNHVLPIGYAPENRMYEIQRPERIHGQRHYF